MNLTLARWLKLLGIFAAVIIAIALIMPALAETQEITVDVAKVVANVEHKLGIGLNFIGDRPEIDNPLKGLQVGTLRFATNEYYLFDPKQPNNPKVAIQDPSLWQVKSFSKPDGTWWGKLNFNQFMTLCRSTKAEPFIVVGIDAIAYQGNAPHATPEEVLAAAVAWVKYANLTKGYKVKYWEIGNESNIQNNDPINWTPEKYAQTVVQFARAMKTVDPSIKIGANGMRIQQNDDWWSRVMPILKNDVDFLVTHQYSWQENYSAWKNSTDKYDYNLQDALKAIATYNPQLQLSVTENSSFNPNIIHTNNTWKMLHNFEMLGQALTTEKVDYIHFWTSRWLEQDPLAENNSAFNLDYQLTPMGYSLKVWNQFLKSKMVNATSVGTTQTWASYDQDGSLSILLLNKDTVQQNVSITLKNYLPETILKPWVLKGATPGSTDVSWNQSGSATLRGQKITTKLAPLSVTAIALNGNNL
jgi:alpha-L-arabinofuranosidase